ncbi:MAG: 2-dehydropantoate 2-reductase [Myxococcota bacterium]|jgi:2-dehydropantoate 2-reductase
MHIGVMGTGAIGGYLGGRLAVAGHRVTLVGRTRFGETLAAEGMHLTGLDTAPIHLPLSPAFRYTTDPAELSDCDAVLVCVKGRDTEAAGATLAETLPPSAVVVSCQNGLRNPDRLRAVLPEAVVLAGMVSFNVIREGPALTQTTSGPIAIGQHDGREAPLLAAFKSTGLPSLSHSDMPGILWGKLQFNLNNAINALSGLPIREQLSDRDFRRLLSEVMHEGLAAQRAAGITPRRLGKMLPRIAPHVLPLPDWLFFRVSGAMLKIDPAARSSMWDDLSRRKPTEIDFLNGEIVTLGQQHSIPTPLNARIVSLIKAAEVANTGSPGLTAAQIRPPTP